jgi:UDP-N-acetylglucosamine 2-epimerase (non-hydrolysing)
VATSSAAKTVAVVVGTRPEVIKLAPVISAMSRRPTVFKLSVVAAAQHRDLLDQMFANLELTSDYDLDLMRDDQGIADYAARSLGSLSKLFAKTRPEIVVVQGDTTTVMTAALAAQYNGAAVAHVEAGLRSFDLTQPFPEEINRRVASVLATIHFAPTDTARANLLAEGIPSDAVHVTGNTVVDAVRAVDGSTPFDEPALATVPFESARVVLVTAHRRENHGRRLAAICAALERLVASYDDVHVVFPVHPNPHVLSTVESLLAGVAFVHLYGPLGYLDMVRVMSRAWIVVTDSGGLQEEATALRKPVLVLRDVTERPEVIDAGAGRLVGTDPATILAAIHELYEDPRRYREMASHPDLFGDGHAGERIADALEMLESREA